MIFLLLLAIILVTKCLGEPTPRLFVNIRPNLRKLQAMKGLYKNERIKITQEDDIRLDEKLAIVLKASPLLLLQTGLANAVIASFVAEHFNFIPQQFQLKVRAQACWLAVAALLTELLWNIDITDFCVRDNYEGNEIFKFAEKEIQQVAVNFPSESLAYILICMIAGYPKGCLLPFVIMMIPMLLRMSMIVWKVTSPGVTQPNTFVEWLFPAVGDQETEDNIHKDSGTDLDTLCEAFVRFLQLCGIVSIGRGMFLSPAVGRPVRGFSDMIMFLTQLLLVQHFLYVQLKPVYTSLSVSSMVRALQSNQLGRQLLEHPLSELVYYRLRWFSELQQNLTSETVLRTIRELLGRHNIKVAEADQNKDGPRVETETDCAHNEHNGSNGKTADPKKKNKKSVLSKKKKLGDSRNTSGSKKVKRVKT